MAIFEGAGVAIVTPFLANGAINFEKLEEYIDFQIDNGTDSIIICGTTGEASTMTDEEQLECIKIAVDRTAGRVPVIAGTGSNDTRHATSLTQRAKALGVDATLQVTPYYNKTTQKGLIEHFTTIGREVDLPMILYSVPSRTGVTIEPKTVAHLAKYDFVQGIKEATGNISTVAEIAALVEKIFQFILVTMIKSSPFFLWVVKASFLFYPMLPQNKPMRWSNFILKVHTKQLYAYN